MKIDNESKVVFMDEYDLDHIFEDAENLGDTVENYESETVNSPEFQGILTYKVVIPRNFAVSELGYDFDNFNELALLMLSHLDNEFVVPYLTKETVDKELDEIDKVMNVPFRERRKQASIEQLRDEFEKEYTYHTVTVEEGAIAKIDLKDKYKLHN